MMNAMSTEEQDQTLGRLTRQDRECRRNLAALDANLKEAGEVLAATAKRFDGFLLPEASERIRAAIEAVEGLPDRDELLQALREIQKERERSTEIVKQLKQFDL